MPHGKRESEKRVFTGKGNLEITMRSTKKACQHSKANSPSPCSSSTSITLSPGKSTSHVTNLYNAITPGDSTSSNSSVLHCTHDGTKETTSLVTHDHAQKTEKRRQMKYSSGSKEFTDTSKVNYEGCLKHKRQRKHSFGSRISMLSKSLLSSKEKGLVEDKLKRSSDNLIKKCNQSPHHSRDDNPPQHDNLQCLSHQPKLSDLLSGSVTSCKLLKENPDFIPYAVLPDKRLKHKSKSLSDLANENLKIQKYLDRRQVIHMDPNDEDCCSHTELAPSTMMTLAMELLEAKNKATNIYKEAKSKLDCVDDEKDSILPQLWVVPRATNTVSDDGYCDIKLASHLQPSRKPVSNVTLRSKNTGVEKTSSHRHATVLESVGEGICRHSGFAYPTTRCIPLFKHSTEDESCISTSEKFPDVMISKDDIENDLKTLSVADLVGSPDTALEEETDSRESQSLSNVNVKTAQTLESVSEHKMNDDIVLGASKLNEEKQGLKLSNNDTRLDRTDLDMHDLQIKSVPTESVDIDNERERTFSVGSSLTTVSSLSSSSLSVGSIDVNRNDEFSEKGVGNKDYNKNSYSEIEIVEETTLENEGAAFLDFACRMKPIAVSEPPKPPRRERSLRVMDRIRKSGREKQLSTRAKRHATDCGNKALVSRIFKTNKPAPSMGNKTNYDHCERNLVSNIKDGEETQMGQSIISNYQVPPKCMRFSQRFQDQDGCTLPVHNINYSCNSTGIHAVDHELRSLRDSYIDADELECCRYGEDRIPLLSIPTESKIRRDISAEVVQNRSKEMEREIWFRNGQISVIDGSRVTLARQPSTNNKKVGRSRGRSYSITQLTRKPSKLFMSDIIREKRPSSTQPSIKLLQEHIVPSKNFATSTSPTLTSENVSAETFSPNGARTPRIEEAVQSVTVECQAASRAGGIVSSTFEGKVEDEGSRMSGISRSSSDYHNNEYSSMYVNQRWQPKKNPRNKDPPREPVLVRSTCYITTRPSSNRRYENNTDNGDVNSGSKGRMPQGTISKMNFNSTAKPYAVDNKREFMQGTEYKPSDRFPSRCRNTSPADKKYPNRRAEGNQFSIQQKVTETANRRQSSAKFNNGGSMIYSSSIRIVVGDKAEPSAGKIAKDLNRVTENNSNSKGLRTLTKETKVREWKATDIKADVINVMEQSEKQVISKDEVPMHSTVDDSEFSGVVDGPTKNVKEIRAMFKTQDHANYAKPKQVLKKTSPPTIYPKPKLRVEKSSGGSNRNSAEVAQQVMGLFKGAMELEKDAQVNDTTVRDVSTTVPTSSEDEPQLASKNKIASFNSASSPTQDKAPDDSSLISEGKRASLTDKQDKPYVEIIKNPSPVDVSNGHERKTSVKQEKVLAESFDESLDQFYDVFDQLTTS